ncbi:MAG: TRAP transporter large permease [Pseudomonadota bacterium]
MDPLTVGIISVAVLMAAILLGFHIGISLATVSVLGIWVISGSFHTALNLLATTSYSAIMDYVFGVLPMFILMSSLANVSGASQELYDAANLIFARVRGGLGITTVIANAIFAAITGVSVASAAVFSKIAVPEMSRLGYNRSLALGTVAGSSVLGMLIPPSALMIIYGILTEEAIGRLFIAGIIPGLVLAGIYCIGIYLMVLIKPTLGGQRPETKKLGWNGLFKVILTPWAVIILVGLVLGGIYGGFFTPTEAGAVGAFGALLLALVKRRLTVKILWHTLMETGYVTASIFLLLISAQMYSRMLAISGLAAKSSEFITSLPLPPIAIVAMFVLVFLVLGCILDSTSILLITIPLMMPVLKALGYNMIWFAVVAVIAVEMGLLTPPFGMVVFAMKAVLVEEVTIEEIFRGSFPFLIMMLLALIVVIAFPPLSTWLPSLM